MQNKIIRIMSIILAAVIIITSGAALSASEVSEISYGQGSGDYEGACDIREDNDLDAEDELLYEDTDEDTDDDNDEDVSEDVNENIDEEYSDIDEIFDDGQVEDQYAAEEIFLDEEGDDQYAAEDMEPDTGDAEDTELYSDEGSEDLNISGIISGNDNRQEQITDGDLTDRDVPEDPEGEYETQEINNEAGPEGRYESDDNEIFAGNDLPDDFSDMDLTSGYEKEAESGIFSDKETESAPEGKSENEAESEIQTGSAPDQGDEPEQEEDTEEITYDDNDNDNDTSVDLYFIDEEFDYSQYYYLNLSSMRLIVGSYDENIFYGDEHLISSYEGMHLLQFEDEETTLRAYAYYTLMADFAEVDSGIMIAEGEAADVIDTDTVMTEEENPLSELEEAVREADVWTVYDIALIDTGADTANGAVSMIGEYTGDDNGHGTAMLNYIREYAPEARVLSVKALGADGKGDVSAVYAAIMYALERGVKVINLSISALAGGDSTVIEQAVNNAAAQGIIVVGSAGNNGRSAKWYVPGKIYSAVIAGACDGEGRILNTSNFGDTVDYLVAADSTSEAAARL